MKTKSGVLVLAAALLLTFSSEAFSSNGRLLSRVKQRLAASMPHGIKQVLLPTEGKQSLVQQIIMGAGIAMMLCTLPSCSKLGLTSQGNAPLQGAAPQQKGYVRTANEVIDRHVHFINEGKHQVGYVEASISATKISIDLYNGNMVEIETNQVQGIRIDEHDDEGRQVIIANNNEGQPDLLHAFVISVYDSNYYEVMVGGYINDNDRLIILERPYVIVIPYEEIVSVFGEQVKHTQFYESLASLVGPAFGFGVPTD